MQRFLKDERGATAIEYAAICIAIVLAVFGAIVLLGAQVGGQYNYIANQATPVL